MLMMEELDSLETPVNSIILQEATAEDKNFHTYGWQNIKI